VLTGSIIFSLVKFLVTMTAPASLIGETMASFRDMIREQLLFIAFWMVLGILSSIGINYVTPPIPLVSAAYRIGRKS
jgi:hypothetical protein